MIDAFSQPLPEERKPLWHFIQYEDDVDIRLATWDEINRVLAKTQWKSHRSRSTREELLEDTLPDCSCCHIAHFSTNWCEPYRSRVIKDHRCFTCDFWQGHIQQANDPRSVRVKGNHYRVDVDYPIKPDKWLGFGGREFDIYFYDGRVIKTNDLWSQGLIPLRFQDQLPDNANFEWPAPVGHGQGFLS